MKKLISAIVASALSLNTLLLVPFEAKAEGNVYEFENGIIYDTGDKVGTFSFDKK